MYLSIFGLQNCSFDLVLSGIISEFQIWDFSIDAKVKDCNKKFNFLNCTDCYYSVFSQASQSSGKLRETWKISFHFSQAGKSQGIWGKCPMREKWGILICQLENGISLLYSVSWSNSISSSYCTWLWWFLNVLNYKISQNSFSEILSCTLSEKTVEFSFLW